MRCAIAAVISFGICVHADDDDEITLLQSRYQTAESAALRGPRVADVSNTVLEYFLAEVRSSVPVGTSVVIDGTFGEDFIVGPFGEEDVKKDTVPQEHQSHLENLIAGAKTLLSAGSRMTIDGTQPLLPVQDDQPLPTIVSCETTDDRHCPWSYDGRQWKAGEVSCPGYVTWTLAEPANVSHIFLSSGQSTPSGDSTKMTKLFRGARLEYLDATGDVRTLRNPHFDSDHVNWDHSTSTFYNEQSGSFQETSSYRYNIQIDPVVMTGFKLTLDGRSLQCYGGGKAIVNTIRLW